MKFYELLNSFKFEFQYVKIAQKKKKSVRIYRDMLVTPHEAYKTNRTRGQSFFITWGGRGVGEFQGITWFSRRTERGSVVVNRV